MCQFDVAAATAWDGDGVDGTYAAPLSVDADARNAADAADASLLRTRARRLAEARRAPAAAVQRLADGGARVVSNSRASATGRRLARGLHADGRRRAARCERGAAGPICPMRRYTTPPGRRYLDGAHRRAARLSTPSGPSSAARRAPVLDARTTAERLADARARRRRARRRRVRVMGWRRRRVARPTVRLVFSSACAIIKRTTSPRGVATPPASKNPRGSENQIAPSAALTAR